MEETGQGRIQHSLHIAHHLEEIALVVLPKDVDSESEVESDLELSDTPEVSESLPPGIPKGPWKRLPDITPAPPWSPTAIRDSSSGLGDPYLPSSKSHRSSSSVNVNRDYILDLADPSRSTSNNAVSGGEGGGSASKLTDKDPAIFQCSLCPKRFTRAYNLRSHLRTHTDERPFFCSVCGKAFARQHDRKRHEGLHSVEKKYICSGSLKDGHSWGCSRRFARVDALGRHFRSEAGRICLNPLLEEEAMECMAPKSDPVSSVGMLPKSSSRGGLELPRALLVQYPVLGMIWNDLPTDEAEETLKTSGLEGNEEGYNGVWNSTA